MSFRSFNAIIAREPVYTMSVIQSGLALAMAFGFGISAEQMAAILTFTASLLAFVVRKKVTPNGSIPSAPPENPEQNQG